MFITEEDYKVVIGDAALKVSPRRTKRTAPMRKRKPSRRCRGTCDPNMTALQHSLQRANSATAQLVMYACDIALYHMVSAMPQKMGSEIRKERYERAIKWLEGVQAGKIIPDLPLATDEEGNASGGTTLFSSQPQLHHTW